MSNDIAALARSIQRQSQRANLKYGACRTSKESRQLAILAVIQYFIKKSGKTYGFPSQAKIVYLLERIHGVAMSRRTLNRDLNELRDAGALKSYRRTKTVPGLGPRYTSSAYYIKDKVRQWSAALRKRLSLLGLTHVPKKAQYEPCLRKETGIPAETAGRIRGGYAPPGQVPEFIPG